MKSANRNNIAVSKLADYAADPEGFAARKGGVRNKKAAQYGDDSHAALGRSDHSRWGGILWVALIAIAFGIWIGWKLL